MRALVQIIADIFEVGNVRGGFARFRVISGDFLCLLLPLIYTGFSANEFLGTKLGLYEGAIKKYTVERQPQCVGVRIQNGRGMSAEKGRQDKSCKPV